MCMRPRRCARILAGIGIAGSIWATSAGAQEKPSPARPDAGVAGDQRVGPGYRREFVTQHQPISANALADRAAAGKRGELDGAGNLVLRTFVDHLPANWMLERPRGSPEGVRVDSFGDPIVNETPGLPAWAQRDVDALRAAIVEWRETLMRDRKAGRDARETEGMLGNFLGQAITRGIAIDDIANIDDGALMGGGVAQTVLAYLHYYENIRHANQELFHYQYTPTEYPARIDAFARAHGTTLAAVRAIEPSGGLSTRGLSCYSRTTFARGMTNLSGPTDIWVANGFDDDSADVPTGFPLFYAYSCVSHVNNDMVRVSTNGYITFFQQGGGALDGANFSNDPIPNGADPDGYVAPWWDDLIVATAQGSTDRVSYKTEGAVDARVFTVEWISISRLNGSTNEFHYFQVKLYETSDVVELHYGLDVSGWTSDTSDDATLGMENFAGSFGDCGPNCTNTNATPPPNNYRFTPSPRPTNDACASAREVTPGTHISDNLFNATPDGNSNCGASGTNRDVWYTFVAPCAGTLRVSACGTRNANGPDSGVDSVVSVHSGCPGTTVNQLSCSDDAAAAGCSANDAVVNIAMVTGMRVFVRVTHFGDLAFRFADGTFRAAFDFLATSPPANDSCASAIPIASGGTAVGSILCASNDGAADCGSSETNNDVWYSFTAPRAGQLTVDSCGTRNLGGANTGPDTTISIHGACPATIANELVCDDDGAGTGCGTLDSRARAVVARNQTVRVRVSHFGESAFRIGNGIFVIHADFHCGADFNGNNILNPQDIFDFLSAWFALSPGADFNGSGMVSPQDIFDFLEAWFIGC